MDLQLAYLAAPQNAAQVNAAQNAPQAAQAAAQSAFINELEEREETVEQTQSAKGSTIQTNPDGGGNGDGYTPQERQHKHAYGPDDSPLGLSADGEHFIDVTV
ncbi:MAG TPA: hypothetical protein VGN11_12550 [Candidatus Baltobacteraceae bacterium]|nr:hypothetical protein [Candidatus Baltobacteraceae bacterium]